jgi:hypothetical protein
MATHWYTLPSLSTLFATKESPAYEAALRKNHRALIAHSALACLAFALLAPTGAILIRLKLTRINLLKLHGYWQLAVWAIYAASVGLGIWLKNNIGSAHLVHRWFDPHAYIGYILLGLLTLQPVLGYAHHLIFKRRFLAVHALENNTKAPGRTPITHGHLWLGRIVIPAGIINGALGIKASWSPQNPLQSVHTSKIAMIIYCSLTGIVYLVYLAICVRHEYRRTMDVVSTEQGAPAAVEVANMPKSRRQSLETGKEILRIAEAAENVNAGRREEGG